MDFFNQKLWILSSPAASKLGSFFYMRTVSSLLNITSSFGWLFSTSFSIDVIQLADILFFPSWSKYLTCNLETPLMEVLLWCFRVSEFFRDLLVKLSVKELPVFSKLKILLFSFGQHIIPSKACSFHLICLPYFDPLINKASVDSG